MTGRARQRGGRSWPRPGRRQSRPPSPAPGRLPCPTAHAVTF